MKNALEHLHEAVLYAYAKIKQYPTDGNAYGWYCARYDFEKALYEAELTAEEREKWFEELRRIKL